MNEIIKVKTGKDLLKSYSKQTQAKQVFGRYIYEGELSILFGDSNAGKSILANDIAFFVSGGGHKWESMKSPHIPTLYIDMEMSGAQFARRYNSAEKYITDQYFRAEVDINSVDDKWGFIRNKIITMQATKNAPKFIIIDNITNGFGSIFSHKQMLKLFADLKTLKERFKLTILVIAHCPKRNDNKPITDNDLGGTKMIMNFADSAFAVGCSAQDKSIRYIKQIKCREIAKDSEVMTVCIKDKPFLSMQYVDKTTEDSHLNVNPNDYKYYNITPEQEIKLVQIFTNNRDFGSKDYMSYYDIADLLKLPVNFVIRYDIDHFKSIRANE